MKKNKDTRENKEIILKAKDLLKIDIIEGLKLFCSFKIVIKEELEDIYSTICTIIPDDIGVAYQKSHLLCKIIENEHSSEQVVDLCFRQIIVLLKSENHELVDNVFYNIQYSLQNFEKQKYGMLHIYLNNTKKISVLKDFFYQFKDPKYVFDVLVRTYEVQGFRLAVDNLSNALSDFWGSYKAETENQILDLFSYNQFGMLAIKIIVSGHNYVYPVDLLKLDTKEKQMLAIKCICNYPHSIDKLLPMVLTLRKSKFKEVKTFLQNKLAELIFETYHSSLLKLVENTITKSAADKFFIIPLRKANVAYEKLKELKDSVKDLNPWENERNLMDLYYRLEHETQAIMMKNNNGDNSFLGMFKNTIIVRGNAWKHEDDEVVAPLGLIQSSFMVDSRAYKNPIKYEQNLENF